MLYTVSTTANGATVSKTECPNTEKAVRNVHERVGEVICCWGCRGSGGHSRLVWEDGRSYYELTSDNGTKYYVEMIPQA